MRLVRLSVSETIADDYIINGGFIRYIRVAENVVFKGYYVEIGIGDSLPLQSYRFDSPYEAQQYCDKILDQWLAGPLQEP